MDFWCDLCQRWTAPDEHYRAEGTMICSVCGDNYRCQTCGFDIDRRGGCLRNASGPPEVVGFCPG